MNISEFKKIIVKPTEVVDNVCICIYNVTFRLMCLRFQRTVYSSDRRISGTMNTTSRTGSISGSNEEILIHRKGRKEMFYLTTHSTHFIYGYMASDIW